MRLPEYSPASVSVPAAVRAWHLQSRDAQRLREQEYTRMRLAFSRTGGLICGDELAGRLGLRLQQPISHVARWIVSRQVLSIVWKSETLLPLFQFDSLDLLPSPVASAAVQELAGAFSDWDIALWFIEPNHLLEDYTPMDALAADGASVIAAARAERFFERG